MSFDTCETLRANQMRKSFYQGLRDYERSSWPSPTNSSFDGSRKWWKHMEDIPGIHWRRNVDNSVFISVVGPCWLFGSLPLIQSDLHCLAAPLRLPMQSCSSLSTALHGSKSSRTWYSLTIWRWSREAPLPTDCRRSNGVQSLFFAFGPVFLAANS